MIKILDKKKLVKYVWSFTLGDGCLFRRNDNPGRNANYILDQLAIHKDYIDWQASILENITSIKYYEKPAFVDSRGWICKPITRITTKVHPFFTTLYERIYTPLRVKSISIHDLKLLDWETLAILYMDDGYIQLTENKTTDNYIQVSICTENYSEADIHLLRKAIYEKVEIPFNTKKRKMKDTYGHRLVVRGKYARLFLQGIEKYILPSFQYKLNTEKDQTIDSVNTDDEIVQSYM